MKSRVSFLGISFCAALSSAFGESPTIPQRPPAAEFQKLTDEWPFALATPAAVVAEPVKGWASNFYVAGIGKTYENGKEETFVAIRAKDAQPGFSLFGNQPNADGISVGGIEWMENLKSKVTLKKGTEFATIEFDEVASHPAAPPVVPGQPPRPVAPNAQPAKPMIRANGPAVPRPVNAPNGAAVPLPGPSNTNAAAPANTPTRPNQRVRVIGSNPQQ